MECRELRGTTRRMGRSSRARQERPRIPPSLEISTTLQAANLMISIAAGFRPLVPKPDTRCIRNFQSQVFGAACRLHFGIMLLQELRQAARALLRAPGLTTISILTVALGVGAATSLFSVVKAVLLNPLPYPNSGRLTWVAEVNKKGRQSQVAYRNFLDWREQSHSFTSIAAFADFPVIVAGGELPLSTRGALADENFFTTLGVSASSAAPSLRMK